MDRGNSSSGSYVFELDGASDVTLDHLDVTGAYEGIYTFDAGSTGLTVSYCTVYGNANAGIDVSTDGDSLLNNIVRDNQIGIAVNYSSNLSQGLFIHGNYIYDNTTGIEDSSDDSTAGQPGLTITANAVYGNSGNGISVANGTALIAGNTVYGQSADGAIGIYVAQSDGGTQVQGNTVYGNYNGIESASGTVTGNRVYDNAAAGLYAWDDAAVEGDYVYDNSVGIQTSGGYPYSYFSGTIANNLVYDNSNQGIVVSMASSPSVVNNTVYQVVGDAVDVQGGSQNVRLLNNILWTQSGYDINVATDSESGLSSDYNLFNLSSDPNANVGRWNVQNDSTLAAWQAAAGQDGHSLFGDPKFVNPAGADGILGYTSANGGYDGGKDDNFSLSAGSPAINSGYSWGLPTTDISGASRSYDDPGTPNRGSPDYFTAPSGQSIYTTGAIGTRQGWHGSDGYFTLDLPFAFSFYGVSYSSVDVSTSGFLQFAGSDYAGDNSPRG